MYKELFHEPQNASEKVYRPGELFPDLRVGMRRVHLTNGESVDLYDTTGVYTEAGYEADTERGIPRLREQWLAERAALPEGEFHTQRWYARQGVVTREMEYAAIRENAGLRPGDPAPRGKSPWKPYSCLCEGSPSPSPRRLYTHISTDGI